MASKVYSVPFSIGDNVFLICQKSKQKFIECPLCEGHGRIKIKEESRSCPDCYGRKGKMDYGLTEWIINKNAIEVAGIWHDTTIQKLTIGQIRFEHTNHKKPVFSAMCKETGIGSGSVYDMNNFFLTEEEAQAECEKRNSK